MGKRVKFGDDGGEDLPVDSSDGPAQAEQTVFPETSTDEESIKLLAEQMFESGYHPVLLFGNSNSGKTSMLLSLMAAVTTRVDLNATAQLRNNLLSADSNYGQFFRTEAQDFVESKLTNFIEGRSSENTTVALPYFVPIDFSPANKDGVSIAFMEGNGEWYQPERTQEGYVISASLNRGVETFMRHFQSGISFIYLLPYTQKESGQTDGYSVAEDLAKKNAGLGIKNVIDQYRSIREGRTQDDRHMLLVTKWDARFDPSNPANETLAEILDEGVDEVKYYLENNVSYQAAAVAFQGLSDVKNKAVRNYCSGRMRGKTIDWPSKENDYFDPISRFPVELWRWLYSGALGMEKSDPFPNLEKNNSFVRAVRNLLSKVIG